MSATPSDPADAPGASYGDLADVQLKELFDSVDLDGSGELSVDELKAAFMELGLPATDEYLHVVMTQYDSDADQTISFAEFRNYVKSNEHNMRAAFARLDENASGSITSEEVLAVLQKYGLPAKKADADRMIALLDKDNNRSITYDEFVKFSMLLPAAQVRSSRMLYCWLDSADWMQFSEFRTTMTPPTLTVERMLAGGSAGVFSRTVTAPIERLRTIIMVSGKIGVKEAAARMWKDGGLRGLWKGNLTGCLKVFPNSALQFAAYGKIKDLLVAYNNTYGTKKQALSTPQKLLAGALAGACATLGTYPIQVVQTHQTVGGHGGSEKLWPKIKQIFAERGIRGFYPGIAPCMARDCMVVGLGFSCVEAASKAATSVTQRPLTPSEKGLLAGINSMLVTSIIFPAGLIIAKLQAQGAPGVKRYNGLVDCVRSVYRDEGARGFYRGLLPTYCKVAPAVGSVYFTYELLTQTFGIGGIRNFRNH